LIRFCALGDNAAKPEKTRAKSGVLATGTLPVVPAGYDNMASRVLRSLGIAGINDIKAELGDLGNIAPVRQHARTGGHDFVS